MVDIFLLEAWLCTMLLSSLAILVVLLIRNSISIHSTYRTALKVLAFSSGKILMVICTIGILVMITIDSTYNADWIFRLGIGIGLGICIDIGSTILQKKKKDP